MFGEPVAPVAPTFGMLRQIDGIAKGIGGCPMADDELVGNMDTEKMIGYFDQKDYLKGLNREALAESLRIASEIFV